MVEMAEGWLLGGSGFDSTEMLSVAVGSSDYSDGPASGGLETILVGWCECTL